MCGRRGIWKHRPPFFVVGVALGNIDLHFVWQAWHLWHWAGSGGALGCSCFWKNRPPFCVAGLALGDIGLHFVWQAWRLWYWAGSGGTLGSRLSPRKRGCLCGRRGNLLHPPRTCCRPSALMTLCAGCSATLRMLPRPVVAIHLYSWHVGCGYIT